MLLVNKIHFIAYVPIIKYTTRLVLFSTSLKSPQYYINNKNTLLSLNISYIIIIELRIPNEEIRLNKLHTMYYAICFVSEVRLGIFSEEQPHITLYTMGTIGVISHRPQELL